MSTENEQVKSKYKALAPFVPTLKIPQHLLAVLNESERYMVESMSKLEQRNEWLEVAAMTDREAVIDLDERVATVEAWKARITSKWSLLIGAGVLCLPVVLTYVLEHLPKWIK